MAQVLALGTASSVQAAEPLVAAATGDEGVGSSSTARFVRGREAKNKISYSVQCKLIGILGRETSTGGGPRVPKSLSFLARELAHKRFAPYKQFQLVEQRGLTLSAKSSTASARFSASGHRLRLTLKNADDKRFKLHVQLTSSRARKALVDVDYSAAKSGGVVIFAGGQHADGQMIFATQCRAR